MPSRRRGARPRFIDNLPYPIFHPEREQARFGSLCVDEIDARKKRSGFESLSDMDHSSAEALAEFPERGLNWAKEQFETVLNETEDYVREKPAESLLCALAVGYILNRLPVGRILGGLFRLLIVALRPAILIYGATKLYQAVREEES
jgi:ElaB/YqjD/DUF883 family membrane-anchored ribosome-binding protein